MTELNQIKEKVIINLIEIIEKSISDFKVELKNKIDKNVISRVELFHKIDSTGAEVFIKFLKRYNKVKEKKSNENIN